MINPKTLIWSFVLCALVLFCALCFGISHSYAQDSKDLTGLSKQVMEAKNNAEAYTIIGKISDIYAKDNKYNECVDFLTSLKKQKPAAASTLNYYIGLTRYNQLKFLEEKQNWDEYFAQGNTYREQLTASLGEAISSSTPKDPVNIYAHLTTWKFHRDQQDTANETALEDLMNAVGSYAKEAKDLIPLRDAAGALSSYDEKAKARQLYKIYADSLLSSGASDIELKSSADNFYKEGNLELAENIYDAYIERLEKAGEKEKLFSVLTELARGFMYNDSGNSDPLYAEKIFGEIDALGVKPGLSEELMYLRAFNLEKAKNFSGAHDAYLALLKIYPETKYADKANFKLGIISAYVLGDIPEAKGYFEKLSAGDKVTSETISSLYQLGLFNQWQQDTEKAKGYYSRLLEKAGEGFPETCSLAKDRLAEIGANKEIEYNLKTFLDLSLKPENASFNMTKCAIAASPYAGKKSQATNISASVVTGGSGCMQIQLEYLWSGATGEVKPSSGQAAFATSYSESGTKVVNLVAVSPSGTIDRSMDFVDIE